MDRKSAPPTTTTADPRPHIDNPHDGAEGGWRDTDDTPTPAKNAAGELSAPGGGRGVQHQERHEGQFRK